MQCPTSRMSGRIATGALDPSRTFPDNWIGTRVDGAQQLAGTICHQVRGCPRVLDDEGRAGVGILNEDLILGFRHPSQPSATRVEQRLFIYSSRRRYGIAPRFPAAFAMRCCRLILPDANSRSPESSWSGRLHHVPSVDVLLRVAEEDLLASIHEYGIGRDLVESERGHLLEFYGRPARGEAQQHLDDLLVARSEKTFREEIEAPEGSYRLNSPARPKHKAAGV